MNDKDICPNTPSGDTVNENGCTDTQLGVDDIELDKSIKFYPNPSTDNLSIDSDFIDITKIEIYSSLGVKLKEIYSNFKTINTGNLSNGLYIIRIYSENGTTMRKLIKE